jgi:hypothetical protein
VTYAKRGAGMRSKLKAGVSPVLSCEGSFDGGTRSFTSFRTGFEF